MWHMKRHIISGLAVLGILGSATAAVAANTGALNPQDNPVTSAGDVLVPVSTAGPGTSTVPVPVHTTYKYVLRTAGSPATQAQPAAPAPAAPAAAAQPAAGATAPVDGYTGGSGSAGRPGAGEDDDDREDAENSEHRSDGGGSENEDHEDGDDD